MHIKFVLRCEKKWKINYKKMEQYAIYQSIAYLSKGTWLDRLQFLQKLPKNRKL